MFTTIISNILSIKQHRTATYSSTNTRTAAAKTTTMDGNNMLLQGVKETIFDYKQLSVREREKQKSCKKI